MADLTISLLLPATVRVLSYGLTLFVIPTRTVR